MTKQYTTCMHKEYAKGTPNKCYTAHYVKLFSVSPSPASCADFERLLLQPFAWFCTIGPGAGSPKLGPNLFRQFGDRADWDMLMQLVMID